MANQAAATTSRIRDSRSSGWRQRTNTRSEVSKLTSSPRDRLRDSSQRPAVNTGPMSKNPKTADAMKSGWRW